MIIQKFKTQCESCGEDVTNMVGVFGGDNDIIVDFLDGLKFECKCGTVTYLEIEKITMDIKDLDR